MEWIIQFRTPSSSTRWVSAASLAQTTTCTCTCTMKTKTKQTVEKTSCWGGMVEEDDEPRFANEQWAWLEVDCNCQLLSVPLWTVRHCATVAWVSTLGELVLKPAAAPFTWNYYSPPAPTPVPLDVTLVLLKHPIHLHTHSLRYLPQLIIVVINFS